MCAAEARVVRGEQTPLSYALERLAELYRYRDLVYNLTRRDLTARYKGSFFGFLWSLFNPLLMMGVWTLLFTVLLPSNRIPNFPLFVLVGLLAWNLNASSTMAGVTAITGNAGLVTRTRFPLEVLPISVALANAVNFLLALVAVIPFFAIARAPISLSLLWLPAILLAQVAFSIGLALLLSTFQVYLRDTLMIVDTLVLAWMLLSPIFYRLEDLFPEYSRLMHILNPVSSFITAYRVALYSGDYMDPLFIGRTLVQSALVLAIGLAVFWRLSPHFAETL